MKFAFLAALTLIVALDAARSEEKKCVIDQTKSVLEATCLYIKLPSVVAPTVVKTISVDPARVAAMPPLPQVDTVVKEVAKR